MREMSLHRELAAGLGITEAELEGEPMAPTTQAYTDFLVRTAATGDFSELCAALLPCMWGFSEIGLQLARGPRPADSRLAAWIDSYADPEFAALANWCRDVVDGLAAGVGPGIRSGMEAAFTTSSRYELAFWEMAWTIRALERLSSNRGWAVRGQNSIRPAAAGLLPPHNYTTRRGWCA